VTDALTVVACLRAGQGAEDELERRLAQLGVGVRKEAGCIDFDLHRSKNDPAAFVLYESWRSRADLDAHFKATYLRDFLDCIDGLLAEAMDLRLLDCRSRSAPARSARVIKGIER
jgi:quinol monooxygenase YgiN